MKIDMQQSSVDTAIAEFDYGDGQLALKPATINMDGLFSFFISVDTSQHIV